MTFTIHRTEGKRRSFQFLSTTSTRFTNTDTLAEQLMQMVKLEPAIIVFLIKVKLITSYP